jgi:hypothetical protein
VRSARCPKKDIILVRVVIFDSCTVYFNWSGNWTQRYNCAARWKNCISDGCFWRVTSVPLYCANLLYLQLKAHTTLFIFLNCSYHIWKLCVKLMCSNLLKKSGATLGRLTIKTITSVHLWLLSLPLKRLIYAASVDMLVYFIEDWSQLWSTFEGVRGSQVVVTVVTTFFQQSSGNKRVRL